MKAHRAGFPLTVMCRVLGPLHQRVLRLAGSCALGAGAARRGASGQDPVDLEREPRDLRPAADPRGAPGARRAGGPQAGGAADEAGGHPGRDAEALDDGHDPQGCEGPARSRPGEPGLLGRGSEPVVGGRHHVRAHLGGVAVPRRRAGRLEPSYRGLGDGAAPADRTGRGRAGDGDLAPPAQGSGDPLFGPGLSTRRWPSGGSAAKRGSSSRWARRGTRTTTRCASRTSCGAWRIGS